MSDEDKRPQNLIIDQRTRQEDTDPYSTPVSQDAGELENQRPPAPTSTGDIYDIVRGIVMSIVSSNITINGKAPDKSGDSLDYSTDKKTSAPEEFAKLNQPDSKAEERKQIINDVSATLEQRLSTPGLDAQDNGTVGVAINQPDRTMIDHGQPMGIRRGGYAGRGQKTRTKGKSSIRQSDRNRSGKDPQVPDKTELPNKVVDHDTSRDGKSFVRLLVKRADGNNYSLVNIDLSSSAVVDPENLSDKDTYYTTPGKDLDFEIFYGDLTVVDPASGQVSFSEDFGTAETLCFRNGLFVGKFASSGVLPPSEAEHSYASVKHIREWL